MNDADATAFDDVTKVTMRLLNYCREHDWAGYDPYDALNSRVFRVTPFIWSKYCRIAFTQLMKRSPINVRPLLLVPKKRNPKGTALFISALLNLKKVDCFNDDDTIHALIDDLIATRSKGQSNSCWGYSFDWQTRGHLVPEGSPNIICTTFAGNALLDAWEAYRLQDFLDHAVSASRFLVERLYDDMGNGEACFNYTPVATSRIHNANLLGAAYVARVAAASGERRRIDLVRSAARYSIRKQAADGSWPYGDADTQRWIDNFHTGYNLCALNSILKDAEIPELEPCIHRGLEFYTSHFFRDDGAPQYFHDRAYPIDVHSVAQSIIALLDLKNMGAGNVRLANNVLNWAMNNLWNDAGYFSYQRNAHFVNRVAYMRWGQAWMLLALAKLLVNQLAMSKS